MKNADYLHCVSRLIRKYSGKLLLYIFLSSTILSFNLSAQWVQVSNGIGNLNVFALTHCGNNVFAGMYQQGDSSEGVYISSNNGANWSQSLRGPEILSFASNANFVFAGGDGLFLSSNNGANWVHIFTIAAVNTIVLDSNNLFVGTYYWPNQLGVFFSSDYGTTWTQTSLGNKYVISLAVKDRNVFAGIYNQYPNCGLFVSTNYGINWSPTSLYYNIYAISVSGNNIFAAAYGNGIFLSSNNGTTWSQTSLTQQNVYAIEVNGNNIFAGAEESGVFVSNNNGTNWVQRNEGLGNLTVLSFCIFNGNLFAGVENGGVFRRPLSELVGIKPISNQVPSSFALRQNYPNPFNPSTYIAFDIPKTTYTKLLIYDINGRLIQTLLNEELKAGSYKTDFDGSGFSSGMYFYTIFADAFSETKKMVLLK